MRSLLLGIDASPKRMGWALVDLVTGEPVACGCEVLWRDRETVVWTAQRTRVRDALLITKLRTLEADIDAEVQAVYAEYPISRFPRPSFDNGRMLGIVQAEVERRWPHAPWQELRPGEWRVLAGLPGNATKTEVWNKAQVATIHARITPITAQDAADALLIATAGQKRNAETWERGGA